MPRAGANSKAISRKSSRASVGATEPPVDYRPNPARSIYISGSINQDLVYSLTPQIIRLQHESHAPITVYIDSPGGNVHHAGTILRLLRSPAGFDSSTPCMLITVATSLAASSAAILLASGDYAIAYPDSIIHFHGMRTYRQTPITVEEAADVARDLQASNEASAVSLARSRNRHFFFRFVTLRSEFEQFRTKNPKAISEKDCFVGIISEKLSPWGMEVIKNAQLRIKRYDSLSSHVLNSPGIKKQFKLTQTGRKPEHYRKLEAEMLRAIIAFELARNKKVEDWAFAGKGMAQVADDFILLNEYIGQHQNDWIEDFCEDWKDFVLEEGDKAAIEALPEDQRKSVRVTKLAPVLLPVWLFFGAICHVLQVEENPLTPTDAFWLGLVDEVSGADLPTLRKVAERKPSLATQSASAAVAT